jgi:lysophospholipase L1-like esterase
MLAVCVIVPIIALAFFGAGIQFQRLVGMDRALISLGARDAAVELTEAQRKYGSHWDIRDAIIDLHKLVIPDGSILLTGDSIVEGLPGNQISVSGAACWSINAGYGGIGVADLLGRAGHLIASTKPKYAILMVGINDALVNEDIRAWALNYERLVQIFLTHGVTVAIATVIPPERNLPLSQLFSVNVVSQFNLELNKIVAIHHLTLIDLAAGFSGHDGWTNTGNTIDGVHPSAKMLKKIQNTWIPVAVQALLQARSEACVSG